MDSGVGVHLAVLVSHMQSDVFLMRNTCFEAFNGQCSSKESDVAVPALLLWDGLH